MYLKTHLAIALFVTMLFLSSLNNKIIFVAVLFIATALPDIDSSSSFLGSKVKFLKFFTKHRGFFHSLTFAILLSVLLAIFLPLTAFPFFLGYSLHLFADSFTIEGIQTFWPLKQKSQGKITTGSFLEGIIFISFIVFTLLFVFL